MIGGDTQSQDQHQQEKEEQQEGGDGYAGPTSLVRDQQVAPPHPGAFSTEEKSGDVEAQSQDQNRQGGFDTVQPSFAPEVSVVAYAVDEAADTELRRRLHDLEEECLRARQDVQTLEQQVQGFRGHPGEEPPGAADALAEEMIRQARLNASRRREYMAELLSLAARGEYEAAVELCLRVLRQLGIQLSSNPSMPRGILKMMRTRWRVLRKSPAQIANMQIATDLEVVNAIQVLNLLAIYSYPISKLSMIPAADSCAINLVMKHGVSPACACSFARMGSILSGCGFFEDSYHFGEVALGVLERLEVIHWLPPAYVTIWTRINVFKVPLRECIGRLSVAREKAEESGYSMSVPLVDFPSFIVRFSAGEPLEQLLPDMRRAREFAAAHQMDNFLPLIEAKLQQVLNLRGHSIDVLVLSGEVMDEEVVLGPLRESDKADFLLMTIFLWKCEIACVMGEYESAVEFADFFYRRKSTKLEDFWTYTMRFYRALASLAVAQGRRSGRNRLRRVALRCLRRLRKVDRYSPQNFRHMTMLIRAEDACLRGDKARSLEYYDESILSSSRGEFLHHQALACERKAKALDRFGEAAASRTTLARARSLYEQWGATCKVRQIDDINV